MEERDCLEDLGVDVRLTLKCIVKKCGFKVVWIHLAEDREGPVLVAGCEHSNEPSDSIKGVEYAELSDCYIHMTGSTTWSWFS
jgi:hypothetical protein